MPQKLPSFIIGIPIYAGVDLLDVAAPCEMFSWLKSSVAQTMDVQVRVVAPTLATLKTRDGLRITPDQTFAKTPHLDLLWVPGGNVPELKQTMADPVYLKFLQARSKHATYVSSVCEGALLAAAAGLLDGYKATTHWAFIPCLASYPKIKVVDGYPRFVVNRRRGPHGRPRYVVTGGGISSGLDEALELIRLIAGKKVAEGVQLSTQYYPDPPVSGTIPGTTTCPLDEV